MRKYQRKIIRQAYALLLKAQELMLYVKSKFLFEEDYNEQKASAMIQICDSLTEAIRYTEEFMEDYFNE